VNESAAKMDASNTLWQEARELYAKCNVEAGVAECNKKLSQ
jgi:exonuclease VII small subunit